MYHGIYLALEFIGTFINQLCYKEKGNAPELDTKTPENQGMCTPDQGSGAALGVLASAADSSPVVFIQGTGRDEYRERERKVRWVGRKRRRKTSSSPLLPSHHPLFHFTVSLPFVI